jgi:hypothetical protein
MLAFSDAFEADDMKLPDAPIRYGSVLALYHTVPPFAPSVPH